VTHSPWAAPAEDAAPRDDAAIIADLSIKVATKAVEEAARAASAADAELRMPILFYALISATARVAAVLNRLQPGRDPSWPDATTERLEQFVKVELDQRKDAHGLEETILKMLDGKL